MSGEVELGDHNLPVIQVGQLERGREIFVQASLKIFVPLAADVIGDEDAGNSGI